MNFIRIVLEVFALYLLYKFIFDLLIPLIRTTRQVKRQFSEMSSRMQDKMQEEPQPSRFQTKQATADRATKKDDYIDFEEVKS